MQRRLCSAILSLQAVVLGLSSIVLVQSKDLSNAQALWIGLGLAGACIVVAGMLRKQWAYWFGWLIQGAALALGFYTPVMVALGVIFLLLWITAVRLGAMIDRDKAAGAPGAA